MVQHSEKAGLDNAYDPRDVVFMYPLTRSFGVNLVMNGVWDVSNWTDHRLGIRGYLDDKLVAEKIHAGVTA